MANMSRLDGVNRCLMNVGIRPVSALDTGGSSEAADVERILDFESRSLQVQGLYENRVMCVAHVADGSGNVVLATTIIGIKSAGSSQHRNFAMRDNGSNILVYNLDAGTLVFTVGETIYLDLTFEIPFESASPSIQESVLKCATEVFARQFSNNPFRDSQLKLERLRTEAMSERSVGRSASDRSNPPAFSPRASGGQAQ